MPCTNPDKVMLTKTATPSARGGSPSSTKSLVARCAGSASPFRHLRLRARLLGRPDPARVCAIGDSVEHDIVGAAAVGLASVLVTTGILERQSDEERRLLFVEHGAAPDFILPKFLW